MRRPLLFGIAGALLLAIVATAVVPRLLSSNKSYNGTLVDASGPPEEFVLESADGDVHLSDFRGDLVVMYFGYTNCPDICPATLSKLAKAREQMGAKGKQVQIVMVSVDPERDDPHRLRQYISVFDESFIGVTGNDEDLRSVATQFGIYFQRAEGNSASGYAVDHTTTLVVLDKDGRQRLFLPYDLTVDQIENDLGNLL